MSSSSITPASGKIVARAASVNIDHACNAFLHDCFKPFGIQIVPVPGDPVAALQRQKFEACLLRLYDPSAEQILNAARSSSSNRPMVIYGIARNTKEALRYASYGINAIFDEPLDRTSVLKVVRSTHLLVIHELRRYARVPLVTQAVAETTLGSITVTTVDISSGGVSVRSTRALSIQDTVRITLTLPGMPRFTLRALVCWERKGEDKVYGLRFDPSDGERAKIRGWIDQQLEIV
jgi:hypothetical protein